METVLCVDAFMRAALKWRITSTILRKYMAIYQLGERTPDIDPSAYVTDSANVIGNVRVEAYASIWFDVTLRGDNELITVGENSNLQEGCVLHTDPGYPLTIGKNVSVGHQAMLHGCIERRGHCPPARQRR
jgi:carbonic anhydrase/acetyltransferase-like protein (isoleucine patch superfamily)